jgi:hypothetical protein
LWPGQCVTSVWPGHESHKAERTIPPHLSSRSLCLISPRILWGQSLDLGPPWSFKRTSSWDL